MMRTLVITDSSVCLRHAARTSGLPVRVLPLSIHVGDAILTDGAPGAAERVYEALRGDEVVKTSPPAPLDYLQAIDAAEAEGAVIVTPGAEFTVMSRSARLAAELATRPVRVVDSRTAAAAQGLVVEVAARAAAEGASPEEVAEVAERASRSAELVAVLETSEMIRRSGRVPALALESALGRGIRPAFRLHAGSVQPLGRSRGMERALERIAASWERLGGAVAARRVVFHADRADIAGALAARLGEAEVVEFSPAMAAHTGWGVFGAAWLA